MDGSEFGGFKITPQGLAFLKQKETLRLRKFTGKAKIVGSSQARAPLTFENEQDRELFDALRAARLELAREQNVPPYVIFHDKTLRELAVQKPNSRFALSGISGVGESKMERYGDIFLTIISQYENGG
jgi:ATP-dependent DNA helicase RecQ